MNWDEFENYFKKKYLQYVKHRADKYHQEHARNMIYKPYNNSILLPQNATFVSIDYIENIKSYYSQMTTGMFRDLGQISFCEIFQVDNINNQLQRSSHCYLSGDPSHDTWMSLYILEKHINEQKTQFTNRGVELHTAYCSSDRSPKEFSCTAFVQGLLGVARRTKVNVVWGFTQGTKGAQSI